MNGYLYNYSDFENIDNVLTEFSKLISPKASLDFTICVQIVDNSTNDAITFFTFIASLFFILCVSIIHVNNRRFVYAADDQRRYPKAGSDVCVIGCTAIDLKNK